LFILRGELDENVQAILIVGTELFIKHVYKIAN